MSTAPVIFDIAYTPHHLKKGSSAKDIEKHAKERAFFTMTGDGDTIYRYMTREGKICGEHLKQLTVLEYLQKSTGVFCDPSATTIKPDRETTFVSEVEFRGLSITDKYEYDLHGNISKRVTGGKEIRYTYDDIDRLVREDNAALNKTYFYEYDDFGNIEKITTYNYTTGNSLTGGVTKTYAYDSSKRLISVTENGVMQSISGYDALGNPSNYKGNTLTWTRGRMLASCGNNSYLYDMDGVRQEKTVNGVVHTYYTDGTKIIAEKVGEKVFEYYYDAQGIVAFKYDGAVYYFKKNLMGDIDRIYDANKNLVAEYKYDAWGNHRVYTGTGIDITENMSYNSSVAKLNPFRYRGYYYDTETGLYYLNSRYYDPSIGRFINADDISYIQPTEINGLNLFAYCGNNPVMGYDPNGCAWWHWLLGGLMVVGLAVVTAVTAGVAGAAIAGAAGFSSLASFGVGVTVGASALAGSLVAGTGELVNQALSNGSDNINFGSLAIMTVSAGLDSALTAGSLFAGPTGIAAIWGGRVVLSGLTSIGYGLSEGNSSSEIALSLAMSLGVTATLGQGMFFSKPFSVALAIMAPFKALGVKLAVSFGKNLWQHVFSPLLEKIFR